MFVNDLTLKINLQKQSLKMFFNKIFINC